MLDLHIHHNCKGKLAEIILCAHMHPVPQVN